MSYYRGNRQALFDMRYQGYMGKLFFIVVVAFSSAVQADEIRIAVASNFLATLKAMTPIYEQKTGDKLIISAASTGKLYAQIINGAPYDVLLAADRDYPEKLQQAGKAVVGSRYVYAQGQLVLWGRNPNEPLTEHHVARRGRKRLAMANPRTAPYGRAAQQVLQKIERDTPLQLEIVQGENIGQAFQFVASGNVELGFVALSQVLNPANPYNRENYWHVPAGYYKSIEQEAALLVHGMDNLGAKRFLEFLKTEKARTIITAFGYH